ncbi:MAG: hypothetical protein PHS49_00635 [Candidatus Gracilibacteria bacterium]|nr:hypothetical protein [Candidatus Gracilibacteria bacterium]
MTIIKNIKSGIFQGIGILLVIGISGVAYGAYVSISSDVTDGQTLTSGLFNNVLENQRSLKILVDNAAPAGFVGAFNLASCPTGWIPANGSNGTPDLRGEFIRGLDGGRGVDSGRVLASWQASTSIADFATAANNLLYLFIKNSDGTDGVIAANNGGNTGNSTTAIYRTVRPRNVALLYCVKQ